MQPVLNHLLTLVLSASVSALVAWRVSEYHHATNGKSEFAASADSAESGTEAAASPPTDDEIKENLAAFALIPDTLPEAERKDAVTDEEIAETTPVSAVRFINRADAVLANMQAVPPELSFGLGRFALLHQDLEIAHHYLKISADGGFGAAYGYLGDPALSRSPSEQWENYDKAESLGFKPARLWRTRLEEKMVSIIERLTCDPQDPSFPQEHLGISNTRLIALNTSEIESVIRDYGFYATKGAPPYIIFGLGRAAFLHEMRDTAKEYLNLAELKGSAAAAAYLAYPEINSDLNKRIAFLEKAAKGDYLPAKRMLLDALEIKKNMPPK